ncbi:tetratricopeptide repeat protein [Rubripirellula tenax]|uniref:tetratricopeptide repeat protein n=1 Tax=Rubripirellula tenax TaxID=2528015 RepID=UPI0011B447BB|nr:tetratricopeptide repeat protein [Rubripirellula tenax]
MFKILSPIRWLGNSLACLLMTLCVAWNPATTRADEMTAESLLREYIPKVTAKHEDVQRAIVIFKTGNFLQARALLEAAQQADPDLPPAGIMLATMLYAADQPALARAELERVGQAIPDEPSVLLLLAEDALANGNYTYADLAFRRCADMIKTTATNEHRNKNLKNRVVRGLAAIAEAREDWPLAVKLLGQVLGDDLSDSNMVARLARAEFKKGNADASFSLLKKHWESDPTKIQRPEVTQGLLFHEAKDTVASAKYMKMAAEAAPKDAPTQIKVAQWALETGDTDMAQACAERAVLNSDPSIESRLLAALVARYKKDYPMAKDYLESVHLESPANLAAIIELAIVLSDMKGMENRGIQYAQLGVKLQPDLRSPAGRNAAMALAWILHRYGGQAESEKILQQVLVGGPISVESSYYAARILIAGKNHAAAKNLLEQALATGQIFPNYDEAKQLLKTTKW